MKKTAVRGGTPIVLADFSASGFGSWGRGGLIVHQTSGNQVLSLIPDSGGSSTALVQGMGLTAPCFLPDGQSILYAETGAEGRLNIEALSLQSSEKRALIEDGTSPHYISPRYLLFLRGDTGFAAPFDAQSIQVNGEAVPVLGGVSDFDVSWNGHLLYSPRAQRAGSELVWMNRSSAATPAGAVEQAFDYMCLSPDGHRVALYNKGALADIWIYDLERATLGRFTFESGEDDTPAWSPDGRWIDWAGTREGEGRGIFLRAADGSGEVQQVWQGSEHLHVESWSPDGKALLLDRAQEEVFLLLLHGERKAAPFLVSRFHETSPQFSPDGRWVAYGSDESGRAEVYVIPYPGPGGKWQVTTSGGALPYWSPDGRELFYRNGRSLMAVSVEAGAAFRTDAPRLLFEADFADCSAAPDGRFLLLKPTSALQNEMHIVLNWAEELKRLVPAGGGR